MKKRFLNKVVVVTGASAGLGEAIAFAFSKEGAHVGLIARNPNRLADVKREIEAQDVRALDCACDISDPRCVEEAAERIRSTLGEIDIWVNNAMVSVLSPVKHMRPEEYRRVIEVNYLGTVNGTLTALKQMTKRDQGTIVQIGSSLAYRGIPLQSAYCASKHAIQGFHDSLRAELIEDGSKIDVCMVQMPALNTPQFDWIKSRMPGKAKPVGPIFQPEIGAAAVLWAAQHPCRELNVTLGSSVVIFGNKLFPGFGDWYLSRNGSKSQQTSEPEDPNRPDNLWQSVDGNFGVHGRFDRQAHRQSPYLWVQTRMRPHIVAIFIAAVLGLVLLASH
jgi:NADP-dependent 3-hydroxy acid dehydrogenase YdfG